MKIIETTGNYQFPLTWADIDYFPNSLGVKREIYLGDEYDLAEGLLTMFDYLFDNDKHEILVYDKLWGDFCLDTWTPENDEYDYTTNNKSEETKDYLKMLRTSNISLDYSGSLICNDWSLFLKIVIQCIITHRAPYSPIFYNERQNYFFYFHHTGSIGFYYQNINDNISNIINKSLECYIVK